jgi:hypothetical protein
MAYSISDALTGSNIARGFMGNAEKNLDDLNKTIDTISSIAYKFDVFLQGLETKKKVEALDGLKFYQTLAQREFENNFALAQADDNLNRFNLNYGLAQDAQEFNQNLAQKNLDYRDKVYNDAKQRYDLAVQDKNAKEQEAKQNYANAKLATQKYNQLYSDYEKKLMATKDVNERAKIIADMDKLAREARANGVQIYNTMKGNAKYGLPTSKSGSKAGSFKITKQTSMTDLFNALKGYKGGDLTASLQEIYPKLNKAQRDALTAIANRNGHREMSNVLSNIGRHPTYDKEYRKTINNIVNNTYEKYINESGHIGDKLNIIAEKLGMDVKEGDYKKTVADKLEAKIKKEIRDGDVHNGLSSTQIKLNALSHNDNSLIEQNVATGVSFDEDALEELRNIFNKNGIKTFEMSKNAVRNKRNINKYLKEMANEKYKLGKIAKAGAEELIKAEISGNVPSKYVTVKIDGKTITIPKSVYEKLGTYYLSIDVLGAYNTKNN